MHIFIYYLVFHKVDNVVILTGSQVLKRDTHEFSLCVLNASTSLG